jgi:hypothetical protein
MKTFLKALFGDAANVAVVAIVMAVELAMVAANEAAAAALIVPPLLLCGAAWLSTRRS